MDTLGCAGAAAIVLASVGMVYSAIELASHWGLRSNVVGMVVVAGLTGIPNVIAAVRLALHQRGAAVVSEALNSNTLNLFARVCLLACTWCSWAWCCSSDGRNRLTRTVARA